MRDLEFERFDRALRLVERYEEYLFRRALGVAFIVNGIVFPSIAFLALNAESLSALFNMGAEVFLTLASTIIVIIGIAVIIYCFTSAQIVTSKMRKSSFWKDAPHMIAGFSIWFISFYLTNYAPEPYTVVSWLWAGGFASLVSYLFMRMMPEHRGFPELLIVGVILLVTSIPILVLGSMLFVETAAILIFVVSFFAGGLYSITTASKVLSESDK